MYNHRIADPEAGGISLQATDINRHRINRCLNGLAVASHRPTEASATQHRTWVEPGLPSVLPVPTAHFAPCYTANLISNTLHVESCCVPRLSAGVMSAR